MDEPESALMTWAGLSLRPVVQTLFKIHGYSGKMEARYLDAAFIAKRTGAPLATVEQGIGELFAAKLVTRYGGYVAWTPWKREQADPTLAQRVARCRDRKRQQPEPEPPPLPSNALQPLRNGVTVRGEESRGDLNNPPDPPPGSPPLQLDLTGQPADPALPVKRYTAKQQTVVDAWADAFRKSPAARRYSGKSARAMDARFREGYTPEELADAVRGWATDPWRHEKLVNHSLECLVRDGGKVSDGIEMLAKSAQADPAPSNYFGIPDDSPEPVKRQWDAYRAGRGDPPQIAIELGIAKAPRRREEDVYAP